MRRARRVRSLKCAVGSERGLTDQRSINVRPGEKIGICKQFPDWAGRRGFDWAQYRRWRAVMRFPARCNALGTLLAALACAGSGSSQHQGETEQCKQGIAEHGRGLERERRGVVSLPVPAPTVGRITQAL
jgi:hypothetical protein